MAGPFLEIACDESGYEGEKLVGGVTDVFAHAGLDVPAGAAGECVTELRRRIRSPAQEYKANHLLREKHRAVLVWLLGPAGPLLGHAHVHLVDKTYLLVGTLAELLVDGDADAVYRAAHRAPRRWAGFLAASNDLLRRGNRHDESRGTDSFYRALDAVRDGSGEAAATLERFRSARPRVDALRTRVLDDPFPIPPLDPLVPAIVAAVAGWGAGGPVRVVHDRQTALTRDRLARLAVLPGAPADVTLVDSRSDARVQLADFLAGVARKVASEELAGRGDAELIGLLRPYVAPSSVWPVSCCTRSGRCCRWGPAR